MKSPLDKEKHLRFYEEHLTSVLLPFWLKRALMKCMGDILHALRMPGINWLVKINIPGPREGGYGYFPNCLMP